MRRSIVVVILVSRTSKNVLAVLSVLTNERMLDCKIVVLTLTKHDIFLGVLLGIDGFSARVG